MDKKLLILDLDETLYHTFIKPFTKKEIESELFEKGLSHMGIYHTVPRPHVDKFLKFIFEKFKVAIWTAADYDYAESAVKNLLNIDINKLEFFFHKKNCLKINDKYIKDLNKLKMENIIMLDNNPQYIIPRNKVINIKDFTGFEKNDDELLKIIHYLNIM